MAPARSYRPWLPHELEPISAPRAQKKRELNLFKARSADAISMSLLVPLLEFNQKAKRLLAITLLSQLDAEISYFRGESATEALKYTNRCSKVSVVQTKPLHSRTVESRIGGRNVLKCHPRIKDG
jgi:hypothetical protein